MTEFEIRAYLDAEHTAKSRDAQLTRIYFINGDYEVVHFHLKDQKPELMKENKWLVASDDSPKEFMEFNGEHFASLKSDRLPML